MSNATRNLKRQNQIHPPLPKKKRVDAVGNDRGRMFYKDGNSTMLLCRCTENASKVIANTIANICDDLNVKLQGNFIYTK